METLAKILHHKIVAILRGIGDKDILNVARALQTGGIIALEVTLNSPGALKSIAMLSGLSDSPLLIGAGTVLTAADARSAIDAGAAFIISPLLDPEVVRITKDAGVISIPGAFTPTEIFSAHKCGADIIKVFPAAAPEYISNILGPLNHLRLMPTGGVNLDTISQFFKAGSVAAGIGSALVKNAPVDPAYLEQLTAKAKQYVQTVSAA